ncbi:hypothetical protein SANA_05270 [Gottschalkiaceae bacterium SANA]|nr:hypothetical protein SANA_05270 [Gottschalkiaceae bacterium SANA]
MRGGFLDKWKENWLYLNSFILMALAFNLAVWWKDTAFSGFFRALIVITIFVIWLVSNLDANRNRAYAFLEKKKIRFSYLWIGTIAVYYILVIIMDLVT